MVFTMVHITGNAKSYQHLIAQLMLDLGGQLGKENCKHLLDMTDSVSHIVTYQVCQLV
jgi:hypothetical protein